MQAHFPYSKDGAGDAFHVRGPGLVDSPPDPGSMKNTPPEPRVLFLLQRYPPAFGGGALFLSLVREAIGMVGIPSIVLTGNRGIEGGRGPGIHRVPSLRGEKLPRLDAYLFALMAGPTLVALRRRFDLIHTMGNGHYAYVAILAGRLLGKPVIISSVQNRCDDPGGILHERFGRTKNRLFSQASGYVCCSGLQVEAYRNAGYPAEKVHFIPNAFDPHKFRPCEDQAQKAVLRERLGLPRKGLVVVSIGAIISWKGIDLLAEGWVAFRRSGNEGTLLLVGPNRGDDPGGSVDDRFVASVRGALSRAGIADSVIFTGRVDNPEEYLRASDVFALMSRGEGFPLSLLEAMGTGLPFVIWNLPDYRGYDLADGDQGFLLPSFDTALLADRLGKLASSHEAREIMGRQARALASRFTIARSVAAHIDLYRKVVAPDGTGVPPAQGPR